ncbi:unnamed protein product [Moneuplotes crassus]|uniref:Uncharacterized protein n=1 Tax=Euplotes crassus TaxID=5936 RepID=A0AAD1U590_EUPCR|nr:unnamed protein product [Moneuplotes crassus]
MKGINSQTLCEKRQILPQSHFKVSASLSQAKMKEDMLKRRCLS